MLEDIHILVASRSGCPAGVTGTTIARIVHVALTDKILGHGYQSGLSTLLAGPYGHEGGWAVVVDSLTHSAGHTHQKDLPIQRSHHHMV